MSKEAYYFSHDSNARNDPKLQGLIRRYGMAGYGRFWVVIELLRDQEDYRLPCKAYVWDAVAMQTQCDASEAHAFIDECIDDFELFCTDGESFWSESLCRRMEARDAKSEQSRRAAQARWSKSDDASAMQTQCDRNAIKEKERKGKENKAKDPSPLGDAPQPQGCPWCENPRTDTEGVHFLLQQWHDRFKQVFRCCPTLAPARDGNLLKSLRRAGRTESEIAESMTTFFETADEWTRANGLTVGVFAKRIDALRTKGRSNAGRRVDDDDDRI